jgi:hypothetical protein
MTKAGEAQLREALRRWRGMRMVGRGIEGEDVSPGCVYGLMTRDAITDLELDLSEVKAELKWVRVTILAAIVTAAIGTLMRMWGG